MEATTLEPREVPLGGQRAIFVRRTLPHRDIRMIGAFCFVDHYGPSPTTGPDGHPMAVPPHPHSGLQTVSWLLSGTIDHRDSAGFMQRVRPSELNLMTAGHGIAHSEYSVGETPLHGLQLWVALPDEARDQTPHFEHHGDLPLVHDSGLNVRVILGSLMGETSKALAYTPIVCVEVTADAGRHRLSVDPAFEHGLLPLDQDIVLNDVVVPRGSLRHEPPGATGLEIDVAHRTRLLLIGGAPFQEELLMWWNFVARTHDEIVDARETWESGHRFGAVVDDESAPLRAPQIPTVRLKPRPSRRN